ncbi:hypothetical protein KPH14_009670 [Odynerus spinipes]|uniref:Uncharacterized protein n=1 Tax=Odynerus spinipes TaxID=1348599 RepID=A0AAD9VQZ4_9HYME|nr:hypothetical protein KPH14_009670 [Odynerus spinipes]
MRVLSALLLTHCFGCVVLKGADDEFTIHGVNDVELSKKRTTKICQNINEGNYTKRGYQRKLLVYNEQDFPTNSITPENDQKRHLKVTTSQYLHLRQRKQSDSEEDTDETEDEYSDDWDDWGAWSPCSVTCGCGQQVRWRHCITDDCTKGLKRAQIKTCHLKPCDKGFLSWLGIKV